MAEKDNPKDPKKPKDPPKEYQEPDPKHPVHRPEGREHQVHQDILDQLMGGGAPPTPEAYKRALEQWQNLPGSIVRPPTDVTVPSEEEPAKPADQGEKDKDQNDKGRKP